MYNMENIPFGWWRGLGTSIVKRQPSTIQVWEKPIQFLKPTNGTALIKPTNGQVKPFEEFVEFQAGPLMQMRPFQLAGMLYAIEKKRCFLADEMGLGKTVQAIAAMKGLKAIPFLVICPASLKFTWKNELTKWAPELSTYIFQQSSSFDRIMKRIPTVDVVICNYDQLKNFTDILEKYGFKGLIFDESHYMKNLEAKRSKFGYKLSQKIENVFLLTGTPVLNRPQELISQLKILGKMDIFGGEIRFEREFCVKGYNGRIIATKNLDILNHRLRDICYIRRNKMDVLKELPSKQHSYIPIEISNRNEYEMAESDLIYYLKKKSQEKHRFWEAHQEYAVMMNQALVRIEILKQIAARGKLEAVTEWIEDFLETDQKLVVFAWHRDIQKALLERFKDAARIFGEDSLEDRQANIERFQNDESCRLIICSLAVGGLGITLTAASNVGTMELGWNPAIHQQAEDRLHRIGQKDSVMSYYFLAKDTIDDDIYELIEQKRAVVDATTEGNDAQAQLSILGELIDRVIRKKPKYQERKS